MQHNDSGHPPLDFFVPDVPPEATQTCVTTTESLEPHSTSVEVLLENDIFTTPDHLRKQTLKLVVRDADTPENDYFEEEVFGSASFVYTPLDPAALIGGVSVRPAVRNNGIGTRLKRQINNHIQQQGKERAYTWLDTDAGERLAARTGYEPTTDLPEYPHIWERTF